MIRARIEVLAKHHDLASFSSDDEGLDHWLHKAARPTGGEGKNRTHLWISEDDSEILGFYTLAPTVVTINEMTGVADPSILLGKMALCEQLRGSEPRVGPQLLLEAFRTALAVSDLIGGRFLADPLARLLHRGAGGSRPGQRRAARPLTRCVHVTLWEARAHLIS